MKTSHDSIESVQKSAQSYTDLALRTIIDVMQSEDASPSARLSAAESILTKAWGKHDKETNKEKQFLTEFINYIEELDSSHKEET